jgi:signal transduction histidine kinase/HAMP domain-containing protein
VRASLSTRIFVGFLVLLLVFAGASLYAVRRMHAIREDLVVIHRGYLAMGRSATQLRTLQEAKDAYVSRALAAQEPGVRRQLAAYARDFYPKALKDRLDELAALAATLRAGRLREDDRRFLEALEVQVRRARALSEEHDETAARLLDATAGAPPVALDAQLRAEHDERREALVRELRSLSVVVDGKISEAVLRAERDERNAAFAVVVLAVVALAVGGVVLATMIRALRPLRLLVHAAQQIGRGALEGADVPALASAHGDEISELSREWNAMARALRDREAVLAARSTELLRLTGFAENVIRSVRAGIVVVDHAGKVRTLNPAARSVFHLPLVDVDGRALRDIVDPAILTPLAPVLDAVEDVRREGELRGFPLLTLRDRIVDVTLVPLRDRAGSSLPDVLLLGEDVTAREETRERLLQSERLAAIGRLAAQITHEIRNPLSSVALNIDLLGDDVGSLPEGRREEAAAILGAVGKEVERLTQITEGYLRFARLPTSRPVPKDVGDLLADLVAFSQPDAAKAGVMLELQVGPALPIVPHDPGRLRQALLDLLRNAVEAAGTGGTVRVGAVATAQGVRIHVEDTGPGIDEAVRAKLFQPFFTTTPQGTGLGLLLAREIVSEHGGELGVERSALGGAAFRVDLPTRSTGGSARPLLDELP